jgi:alkylhydroperoxidase family enzyme
VAGHTALARQLGYTEAQLEAMDRAAGSDLFDPAVKIALEYAERMTRDAHTVTDAFFADLRRHYSDTQILELTCVVGLTNYWNRFTTALRIDLSGTNEPYDAPSASP